MSLLTKLNIAKFFSKSKIVETVYKKSKHNHLDTGYRGEQLAKKHLRKKGFKIIKANYRTPLGEIDLITRFKDILVFVEVRTKSGVQFGTPEQSLNQQKIKRVVRNAQAYIKYKNYRGRYRIDSVCVVLRKDKNLVRLNHYQNITL